MSTADTDKNTACPRKVAPGDKCDSENTKASDSNSDVSSSVGEAKCSEKQRAKGNRRVTFPESDKNLVTQYFEPANPWQHVVSITPEELAQRYLDSCLKHNTKPIDGVYEQIKALLPSLLTTGAPAARRPRRAPRLRLGGAARARRLLGAPPADALEPLLQQVQFARLDADVAMDDECAVALFDMIEYYESATTLNISGNKEFGIRGWQACSHLIKKSECVRELEARDTALAEEHAPVLCRALRAAACRLRALRLQHSRLAGQPLVCLAAALKQNTSLEELQLGDNGLTVTDAIQLGSLLRYNTTLQLLDISNNEIQDMGVSHIADGLVEQSQLSHSTTAASSPASPADSSPQLESSAPAERGLAVLVLWNNHLTRNSANHISRALSHSRSLCVLNVGRNAVGAEVVRGVRAALTRPAAGSVAALLCLGLQAARLGCDAGNALAELIEGETQLQRIDLRDNRLQTSGLKQIANAMRENHTITQIDLDDVVVSDKSPNCEDLLEQQRLVSEIRSLCARNDAALAAAPTSASSSPLASPQPARAERKISLTCAAACGVTTVGASSSNSLLAVRGAGDGESGAEGRRRLRSPAPSPIPSPVSSPTPSPARARGNRFQVSRVTNDPPQSASRAGSSSTDDSSAGPSPASTPTRRSAHFFASRFRVEPVAGPPPAPPPAPPPVPASSRFSVTRNLDTSFEIATAMQPCVKSDSVTVKSDGGKVVSVKNDGGNLAAVKSDSGNVVVAGAVKSDTDDVIVKTHHFKSKNNRVAVAMTEAVKVNDVPVGMVTVKNDIATVTDDVVDRAGTVTGTAKSKDVAVPIQAIQSEEGDITLETGALKRDIGSVVTANDDDIETASVNIDKHNVLKSDVISDLENIIKNKTDLIEVSSKIERSNVEDPTINNCIQSDKKSEVTSIAAIKIDNYDVTNVNTDLTKGNSESEEVHMVKSDIHRTVAKNVDNLNLIHPSSDNIVNVSISERSHLRNDELVVSMSPVVYDVKPFDTPDSIRTKNCDKVSSDKRIVQMDVRNVDKISFSKNSVPETDPMKKIEAITEDLGNLIEEMKLSTKKSQLSRKASDIGEKCKGDIVPAINNVNNSENVRTEVDKVVLKKNMSESSLGSPDLEVLRYMRSKEDDRRAFYDSTSSLEVSGSSVESLNASANPETKLVVTECERRPVLFSVSSNNSSLDYATDTSTPVNSGGSLLQSSLSSNESVSPNIFGKHVKIHGSLSSLEASVSSLDSYRAPNLPEENITLMALSSDSGIDHSANSGSDLKGNVFEVSSNEGTLTNSEGLGELRRNMSVEKAKVEERVGSLISPKRTSSLLDVPALKSKGLERVRKISWVAPSPSFQISKQTSDSDSSSNQSSKNPTNLEKLLSLFQHPGSLFSRSSSQNLDEEETKSEQGNVGAQKKDSLGGNASFWSWGLGGSGLAASETKIASKSSDVGGEKVRTTERQESYCASPAIITSDVVEISEKFPERTLPIQTGDSSEQKLIDLEIVESQAKATPGVSVFGVESETIAGRELKTSALDVESLERVQVSYVDAALSGGIANFLSDRSSSVPEDDVFVELDYSNPDIGKRAMCSTVDKDDTKDLIDFSACDVFETDAREHVSLPDVTRANEKHRLDENRFVDELKRDVEMEVQNIDNDMPVSISECNISSDLSSKNDVASRVTDLSNFDDDSDVVSQSHGRSSVKCNVGSSDSVNSAVGLKSVAVLEISNPLGAETRSERDLSNISTVDAEAPSGRIAIIDDKDILNLDESDVSVPLCIERFGSTLSEGEEVCTVLGVNDKPSIFPELGTDLCNISILEKNLSDKKIAGSNPNSNNINTVPILTKDIENMSSVPSKDTVASIVMATDALVRPRTFAAVLKQSSSAENSLERHQAGTEIGQSIENLPTKVKKGIKENISPENTLTSSMTNTKALVQELAECKTQKSPARSNQSQVVNTVWEVRSMISEREKGRKVHEEENLYDESFYAEPIDVAKDALALLDCDFEGNTVSAANFSMNLEPESVLDLEQPLLALDAELRNAERSKTGNDCDYSPELVMDEIRMVDVPFFKVTEIKRTEKLCTITSEKLVLKKATSMEDFQAKSFIQVDDIDNLQFKCSTEELREDAKERTVVKMNLDKNLVYQIPESTSSTPQNIPALGCGVERRHKLRTKKSSHRRGCSPKSLPDSLSRQASLKALSELPIVKPAKKANKKHNISSLGKMARDSLLALNISEEEISEFRQSHNLTSVESLRSLESVSEDAASHSGNSSNDSRCRTCIRTSQESLISLDSISEDCRSVGECELCVAGKGEGKRVAR